MRGTSPIVLAAADKLADFPRLYEVDSRYGEDVRISLMGQHVLYDVNDPAQKIRVLAVVGQRQNPHRPLITGDGGAPLRGRRRLDKRSASALPHCHHRRGVSAVSVLCSSSLMACISCRSPATSSRSAFISAISASDTVFSVSSGSLNPSRS
jgi:hypothetical protein